MSFPAGPSNNQQYTNALGTVYQFNALNSAWKIVSQNVTGAQGVTGWQGITGVIGLTGLIGITGIRGVTGLIGLTGAQGVTGLIGLTGLIGITGIRGVTGLIGLTGAQGITGTSGATGLIGLTGAQGVTGVIGLTGLAGTAGSAGTAGGATGTINIIIDGGGSAITTGVKADIVLPFRLRINNWNVLGNPTGSILIGLWKNTYASFPPTSTNAMHSGATGPYLPASSIKNQNTAITGWACATGAADDIIRVNVDSVATVQLASVSLDYFQY